MRAEQALDQQHNQVDTRLDVGGMELIEPTEAEIEEYIYNETFNNLDLLAEAISADGVHDVVGERWHTETHPRYLKKMHQLIFGGVAEAIDLQNMILRQVSTHVRPQAVKELEGAE